MDNEGDVIDRKKCAITPPSAQMWELNEAFNLNLSSRPIFKGR